MLSVNPLRRDAVKEDRTMRKNRNLVQAQVNVNSDAYALMLNGTGVASLTGEVTAAMNRKAAERKRRVFGDPWQTEAVETDGVVAVTFEAFTEPA